MQNLVELIKKYYKYRGLKYPNVWESLAFATTELGEVYEILLSRSGGWVRNNPQDKPEFDKELLAKELGDVLMMIIVAGIVEDVDPVQALENKIESKLRKFGEATVTFTSAVESIE